MTEKDPTESAPPVVSPSPEVNAAQAEKYLAEAEKARAEADAARAKEAREQEIHRLVLKRADYELGQLGYSEREQLLHVEHVERVAAQYAATDARHLVYRFLDEVGNSSVNECMSALSEWSRMYPEKPMEIIFSSPGGSIISGMALFDFIVNLRDGGHKVTTGAQGYAASMAGVLLQAGDVRWLGRNSSILIHEASTMAWGKTGQIEDEMEFTKKLQDRIVSIFVERSGGKLTERVMRANWKRKDWWLVGAEALKLGLVDELR